MAERQPTRGGTRGTPGIRRAAVRYGVPVVVAGLAAATVGLAPALANSGGDPDLPGVTAEELITKIAESDTEQLSGTVRVTTDLGLPELPGLGSGGGDRGGMFGSDHGEEGEADTSSSDPRSKLRELASGTHLLRVAADGPDKQRVSVLEEAAEYSLIRNGDEWWSYDSAAHRVHHGTLPDQRGEREHALPEGVDDLTPREIARKALDSVDDSTEVRVDGTSKVADRDAYQLVIEPNGGHSTVGSVRIAVDAENGVPLKFSLLPSKGGKAAVDVAFTKVDFSEPAADTFAFTPPKGAEVIEVDPEKLGERGPGDLDFDLGELNQGELPGLDVLGGDWDAIARVRLPGGVPLPDFAGAGEQGGPAAAVEKLLDAFTEKADGDFGTGRVITSRLVNALITEDGTVYVGAVTPDGLVKAAEEAEAAE